VSQKARSTFVLDDPTEILGALVALKAVPVLHYVRHGPDVGLMIEQVPGVVRCPTCRGPVQFLRNFVGGAAPPRSWTLHHRQPTSLRWHKRESTGRRQRGVTVGHEDLRVGELASTPAHLHPEVFDLVDPYRVNNIREKYAW
jgi:hypothetical protein